MSKIIDWEQAQPVWEAAANVIAAWAFGSAQDGHVRSGGDVDIGILFEAAPSLDELTGLLADLQNAFQIEAVDLVPLNEANPILRFEAASGRPLFCRDPGRRAEFVSLTAREYEDEMAFLERSMANRR